LRKPSISFGRKGGSKYSEGRKKQATRPTSFSLFSGFFLHGEEGRHAIQGPEAVFHGAGLVEDGVVEGEDWRFTTADARIRLKRPYPQVQMS